MGTVAALICPLLSGSLPCGAAQDPQYFKNGVAGVQVGRLSSVAGPSKGTGLVISVSGDTASVLTARHLLVEGSERFSGPGRCPSRDRQHDAHLYNSTDSKPLLLTERLNVFGGKSQDWQVAAGEISDVGDGDYTDRFRFVGPGDPTGFSGAPIMDESFQLIGIHLSATDNEAAYARAVTRRRQAPFRPVRYGPLHRPSSPKESSTTLASDAGVHSPVYVQW